MPKRVLWNSPSLCGCQLTITADWLDGTVNNGVAYAQPKAGTITNIQIVNVCAVHQGINSFDTSCGYMAVPAGPSPDQCLYSVLCRNTGQVIRPDTCGCTVYQYADRTTTADPVSITHPVHTVNCARHVGDTGVSAVNDNKVKNYVVAQIIAQYPSLTVTDAQGTVSLDPAQIILTYDDTGTLNANAPVSQNQTLSKLSLNIASSLPDITQMVATAQQQLGIQPTG